MENNVGVYVNWEERTIQFCHAMEFCELFCDPSSYDLYWDNTISLFRSEKPTRWFEDENVSKEDHDEAKENYEIEIEKYWKMINEKVLDAMYDEAEVSARESSDGGAFFENRDIQGALDDIYSTLTECIDEWDDFNRITNGYRAGADVEIRAALEITISNARSKFIELNGEECADGDASE